LKRKGKMTLKREVFWLCQSYSLIFTLVFMLLFGNVLFSSKFNEMKQKLHTANAEMKIYLDTLFEGGGHLLHYFDDTLLLASKDPREQAKTAAAFRSMMQSMPELQGLFVGYADGDILINDHELDDAYDATLRPWYQGAVETYPRMMNGLLYHKYTNGEWCFCMARALPDETGEIAAVMAVDFSVQALLESAIMQNNYKTQTNFLMDENGVCTYHPNKELIGSNLMDMMKNTSRLFLEPEGYIEYTHEGERRIAYYHYLDHSDSVLVSAVNRRDVITPAVIVLLQVLLGLLLLSVLMSTVLMTLFDHRYVKPVKSLKNRLAALLTGETTNSQKLSYPNEEFSEIADSIEGLTQSTMNRKAEELSAVLESSNDGILVLDRNDRVLHYNTRLLTLWGLAEKNVYNAYGDLGFDQRVITTEGCSHPSAQVTETQLCYLKSGTILERYIRTLIQREHIDGILCVYRDVTEKIRKEEQLREIANTDFLTGLNNRRYFAFLAAREFNRARESDEILALLMIDIDHFKNINDTYGHDIGDKALQAFAVHLRRCSRRSDVLGRYGGEEFCVLLPLTNMELAEQIAERVRMHYEKTVIRNNGQKISWTVSIGVAISGKTVTSVETLIKHADIACYAAKQHGRNRVMTYSGKYNETSPKDE